MDAHWSMIWHQAMTQSFREGKGIYSVRPGDLWIIHESPGFVVIATKNRKS